MDVDRPLPPPKRRRHNRPALRLQDLPLESLKKVLSHLHPVPRVHPLPLLHLKYIAPLRLLCRQLRDAFDAHVTSLSLATVPHAVLPKIIPRLYIFRSLKTLMLSPASVANETLTFWDSFWPVANIRDLTLTTDESTPIVERLTAVCAKALVRVSTTSEQSVQTLAAHNASVQTFDLLMDTIDASLISRFPYSLRALRVLYRQRIPQSQRERLVESLSNLRALSHVEIRLNGLRLGDYAFLPHIRCLKKISLFDGVVDDTAVQALCACSGVEELFFEWMRGFSGRHLENIAGRFGTTLKKLRIWNCEDLDEGGLRRVAALCPNVELEVRFIREQFGCSVLALFGDRVSWASSM